MHSKDPSLFPLSSQLDSQPGSWEILGFVLFCYITLPSTSQQFRSHGGKWGWPKESAQVKPGVQDALLQNLVMEIWSCFKEVPRPFGRMSGFLNLSPWLSFSLFSRFCKHTKNQSVLILTSKWYFTIHLNYF